MAYSPNQPAVMYQPGPVGPAPVPGQEYGGHPGGISPAPAVVAVGVPPGLEYLTQVGQRDRGKLAKEGDVDFQILSLD